jgi:TolA-binding protein
MKNILTVLTVISITVFIFSCKSPENKAQERITGMQQAFAKDTSKVFNKAKANELLMAYKSFSDSFPKNDSVPEYLYQGARLANGLTYTMEAIGCYKKVYDKYPESKRAPFCLFMEGFIYENTLHSPEMAKKLYEEFLKKYPNHEIAKDVRFALDNLGKSDEDIMKMIQEKQAKKGKS